MTKPMLSKIIKVIVSCNDKKQLPSMERYHLLALRRYSHQDWRRTQLERFYMSKLLKTFLILLSFKGGEGESK